MSKTFAIKNGAVKSGLLAICAAAAISCTISETICACEDSGQAIRRRCGSVTSACVSGKVYHFAVHDRLQSAAIGIDRNQNITGFKITIWNGKFNGCVRPNNCNVVGSEIRNQDCTVWSNRNIERKICINAVRKADIIINVDRKSSIRFNGACKGVDEGDNGCAVIA